MSNIMIKSDGLRTLIEYIFSYSRYLTRKELTEKLKCYNKKLDVLDVGAGDGRFRDIFREHNYKTQDICLDKNFNYNSVDYPYDLDYLIKQNLKFDFIVCTSVLEHVFDYEDFIRKLSVLVRSEGKIFLTTNFMYPEHALPNDFFRFSKRSFHFMIEKSFNGNLEIIECKPLEKLYTYMLDFFILIPFYFFGDKSNIAKIILIPFTPILILLRLINRYILDKLDKKQNIYSTIFVYLEKK